ncbi:hypothetical protein PRZ48_015137 [Zasmidium cellare]|uniref:Uncharacterized protein n=1 Tax=Zasmidium cellare TaxID=395010 RepID=A0ABR0DXQ8_ZASCE|nr:hypothetical protein PRZ48_015137 [Zasmidium cellare]
MAQGQKSQKKRKHDQVDDPQDQAPVSAQSIKQGGCMSIIPPKKKADGVKEQKPKAAHTNEPPTKLVPMNEPPQNHDRSNALAKPQDEANRLSTEKPKKLSDYRKRPFEIRVWSRQEAEYTSFWPLEVTDELKKRSNTFQEALVGHVHFITIRAAAPQVCAIYLHLVGQNEILLDDDEESLSIARRWARLVQLYIFAYNLGDSTSAKAVIDEVIEMVKAGPPLDSLLPAVKLAREETNSKTGLYRVMVDYLAIKVGHARFEKMRGAFHDGDMIDVVIDVVVAAKKSRSGSAATWLAFGAAAYYPKL